jgi:hypothetical protein
VQSADEGPKLWGTELASGSILLTKKYSANTDKSVILWMNNYTLAAAAGS